MANLLYVGDSKIPYSVIGGTTAYIQMTVTVPVKILNSATGVTSIVQTPISFGDATISAGAYVGSGGAEQAIVSDSGLGDGSILVNLTSASTSLLSQQQGVVLATLDLSATLNKPIVNTSYQAGDTIGYRWSFFIEANIKP